VFFSFEDMKEGILLRDWPLIGESSGHKSGLGLIIRDRKVYDLGQRSEAEMASHKFW
jgi:hypothetical protein